MYQRGVPCNKILSRAKGPTYGKGSVTLGTCWWDLLLLLHPEVTGEHDNCILKMQLKCWIGGDPREAGVLCFRTQHVSQTNSHYTVLSPQR